MKENVLEQPDSEDQAVWIGQRTATTSTPELTFLEKRERFEREGFPAVSSQVGIEPSVQIPGVKDMNDPVSHARSLIEWIGGLDADGREDSLDSVNFLLKYINDARMCIAGQAIRLEVQSRAQSAQSGGQAQSFAEAAKLPAAVSVPNRQPEPEPKEKKKTTYALFVGPSDGQIKPRQLKVSVTMKAIRDRKMVVIESEQKADLDRFQSEVNRKIKSLRCTHEKRLKPRILIRQVPFNLTDEELIAQIVDHNLQQPGGTDITDRVRIVHRAKRSNGGKRDIIIELDAELRHQLIVKQKGQIKLDFLKLKCFDTVHFRHCWKCQSHEHQGVNCKEKSPVCSVCGDNHLTTECRSAQNNCFLCEKSGHAHQHKFASAVCSTASSLRRAVERKIDNNFDSN